MLAAGWQGVKKHLCAAGKTFPFCLHSTNIINAMVLQLLQEKSAYLCKLCTPSSANYSWMFLLHFPCTRHFVICILTYIPARRCDEVGGRASCAVNEMSCTFLTRLIVNEKLLRFRLR